MRSPQQMTRTVLLSMSMIFMALAGVLIVAPPAKAISLNTSFFSDDYYETTPGGDDVLAGGVPNYAGNKEGFISFIKGKLQNGGANSHDHIGAAFIVYTMLGYEPGNNKNGPSSDEIAEWERRIRSPRITIDYSGNIESGINSMVFNDNGLDAMFFWFNVSGPALVFKYDGRDMYYLRLACANPVGDMPGLPEVPEWYINGQSYVKLNTKSTSNRSQGVNAVTAKPGDTVYWDHDLRNTGPDDMERDVTINIDRQDRSIETGEQLSFNSNPAGDRGRGRVGQLFYVNKNINHTVGQGDVGKKLCQLVSWRDGAWDDSNWYDSEYACVNVPYNYSLTPTITDNLLESIPEGENTVEVGATIPTVNNGGPTKSKNAKDAVVRYVVRNDDTKTLPAGEGITKGGSNWACDVAQEIGIRNSVSVDNTGTCKVLAGSSDEVLFPPSGKVFTLGDDDISDLDSLAIGDRICYVTMVSAYDQDTSIDTFRYSQSVCVRIAKKPKVQVWGSDVRVGDTGDTGTGNIKTSNTRRNGKLYGSWAEYSLLAPGSIVSASGAGLSGSEGRTLDASYNALTFANTPPPEFGHFGVMPRTTFAPEYNNMEGIPSDVTLGDDIPAVVKTAGTVTITQNITSDDATQYTTIAGLPQHIIIAKNIIIKPEVTRVDAWLISQSEDGYISTCGVVSNPNEPFAGLSASVCNQQLRITGPVIAEHLFLRRTAGSGRDDPGAPAEIINIRPDTYLWAYSKSMEISPIKTMYVRELPPRF